MKKIIIGVMAAGVACAVFATDARVETMGNTDRFFADEISIHNNAANLGLYDKIMYGSYGHIDPNSPKYSGGNYSLTPELPMFGGAISIGQKEGDPSKVAVGLTFNRIDSALNYIMFNTDALGLKYRNSDLKKVGSESVLYNSDNPFGNKNVSYARDKNNQIDLMGKVDLMVAYTIKNGTTIGLGSYIAFQDKSDNDAEGYRNRFVRGNVGVNTSIGDGVNLEASVGFSTIDLRGISVDGGWYYAAKNDIGTHIDVRMFADVSAISAAFVPHIQANIIQYANGEEKLVDFNAGLGFNLNIDRGFFWAGIEGLYNKMSRALVYEDVSAATGGLYYGNKDRTGGKIGFGIERNVLTDWFIIRVGGAKLLAKETLSDGKRGSYWLETSDVDHVSLGMGVNIEDRLKIDFTVAQNLPYTFTSLFSTGNNPYIASRVSAVFSF